MECTTNKYFCVRNTNNKGRGLFATRCIIKGTIIEISHTIEELRSLLQPNNILGIYSFENKFDKTKILIALGFGSLFNHDNNPNVDWKVIKKGKFIRFKALKDIWPREELLINYGYDPIF